MNRLPTYEECKAIVHKEECFKEKTVEVAGRTVHIFGAFLSIYPNYINPLGNGLDAWEMRGITFVEGRNGEKHRFLSMSKFFNVDQVEATSYNKIKNKQIISCQDKLDGSLISFVEIDGVIYPKTKMDFTNDQCQMARRLINQDEKLQGFLRECFDNHLMPLFELCSPHNRIVLRYGETSLKLTQIRSNVTGEYFSDVEEHWLVKKYDIPYAGYKYNAKLKDLMEKARELEDVEGWVVKLEGGMLVKVKTDWYFRMHSVIADKTLRENLLLTLILKEEIDDVLAVIEKDDPIRDSIDYYTNSLRDYIKKQKEIVKENLKEKEGKERKDFFTVMKDKPQGFLTMYFFDHLDEEDLEKRLVAQLLKETYRLKGAREFCAREGLKLCHETMNTIDK